MADNFAVALWTLGISAIVMLGLDYWRTSGRVFGLRFPQIVAERPNLVIGIAQPADMMAARDDGEWLHLTVKNRKPNGRRTRTARDCIVRTIIEDDRQQTTIQLRWTIENGPAKVRRDIHADERAFVPLMIRGFPRDGQSTWAPAYKTVMNRGDAHLTVDAWYQAMPGMPLVPGWHYNIEVRVEYDGGRLTKPAHFALRIPKDPTRPSTLEPNGYA